MFATPALKSRCENKVRCAELKGKRGHTPSFPFFPKFNYAHLYTTAEPYTLVLDSSLTSRPEAVAALPISIFGEKTAYDAFKRTGRTEVEMREHSASIFSLISSSLRRYRVMASSHVLFEVVFLSLHKISWKLFSDKMEWFIMIEIHAENFSTRTSSPAPLNLTLQSKINWL